MTTELEALEQSMAESPEDISEQRVDKNLDGVSLRKVRIDAAKTLLCGKVCLHATYGKKLIWCDAASEISEPHSSDFMSRGRRFQPRTHTIYGKKLIWCSKSNSLADPENLRAVLECYRVEYPEKDYPEHSLWPRGSRNASPTRKKDASLLNAFWEYRELNESVEPLQSNYGKADNDKYTDPDWEQGDIKKPERDVEAELETRPNMTELVTGYSVPMVKYETRTVRSRGEARLSEDGYLATPISREMIVPVTGDVECMVRRTTIVKKGNRLVERERDELVKTRDLKKDDKWTLYRIGDLRFAPYSSKHHYRGQVTHYRDNGRWFPAKDEYGTPYGPKSIGSNDAAWVPLKPRTTKCHDDKRSPEEKAKQKAKQRADKDKRLPCPTVTDEELEAFRLKLETNGKPANDNRAPYDGLSYKVESADELQYGYAFGKTHASGQKESEPFDDVVERKQLLAAVNARLSPQTRRVANMVVQTDETAALAQNYEEIGAALVTGLRGVSQRTLTRRGQKAANDAAEEINKVRQELAA